MSTHERAHQDGPTTLRISDVSSRMNSPYPTSQAKDVLDVGCGNAYGTALMARSARNIQGVDYDAATVADNAQRYSSITNLSFRQERCRPCLFRTSRSMW